MLIFKGLMPLVAVVVAFGFCKEAGAQTLSLDDCRRAAREKARSAELEDVIDKEHQQKENIIKVKYRPELSFYGETHYQSDAPDPTGITDFPFELYKLDKFQYHAGFMLTQSVYRGGTLKLSKEINDIDKDIESLENESYFLELENTIDEIYLDIILASKEEGIAQTHRDILEIKLEDARKAFDQGVGYRSDILTLEAGLAEADAGLAAYAARRNAGLAVLSELTGLEITSRTELELPYAGLLQDFTDPTFGILDLQGRRIEAQKRLELAKTRPSVNAFGTVGYGLWSLDFFNRNPQFYGVVGLTLSIPITSRQSAIYRNRLLSYQSDRLQIQKEALTRRQSVEKIKLDGELARIEALLESSGTAVSKYEALCEELDKMTKSGVSSQSEYLEALKKLSAARVSYEAYSILKIKTRLMKNRSMVK